MNIKKCSLIILLLFYAMISIHGWSKPPDIVWRVDTRDYYEVFNNGFYSSGTNDDIIEHLSGRSCRNAESDFGDSAFISTTSDRRFAYEYTERMLRHMHERGETNAVVNVYQIRATDNMYSANQTLDFFYYSNNRNHMEGRVFNVVNDITIHNAHAR